MDPVTMTVVLSLIGAALFFVGGYAARAMGQTATGQVATEGVQQYLDTVSNPALDKPFGLPQLREVVRARVDRSFA